jgi:RalA-binding protein 1
MDAEGGSRSTPTPPPAMSMQQMAQMNAASLMHARSTPTPPPSHHQYHQLHQQQHHHQQPYQQQHPHGRSPAPYETGFDGGLHNKAAAAHAPSPAYERPAYENGLSPAPYEQPYRSRRESAMFMGTLSQQPSKSRLREEAQY